MTFWPGYSCYRNDSRNRVKVKDELSLILAPSTEFEGLWVDLADHCGHIGCHLLGAFFRTPILEIVVEILDRFNGVCRYLTYNFHANWQTTLPKSTEFNGFRLILT